jgi:hypothetical protein
MTDVGNTIKFFNPSPNASYNQRWQFSIQRQFGGSNMMEVAYVGNRSTKLEITRDLNIVGNQMLSRSPFYDAQRVNYLTANVPNPFRGLLGVSGSLGANATITRETLLKPYPQFSAVNTTASQGYAWYHSMYVRGARRLSASLLATGSFTWAKSMAATSFLNPADEAPYRSLSGIDRPIRVTGSIVYQLPFGRNGLVLRRSPQWLDTAIGGWQLAAIYISQSGTPLAWGDAIFLGNPEAIASGPRSVEHWFNVDAGFTRNSSTRPSYHYRTWPLYLSTLRRDGSNNLDFSIAKRWHLTERLQVQARGEAINAFNHPQFAGPTMDQFSSSFGQITATANYPRQIQAVLKLSF